MPVCVVHSATEADGFFRNQLIEVVQRREGWWRCVRSLPMATAALVNVLVGTWTENSTVGTQVVYIPTEGYRIRDLTSDVQAVRLIVVHQKTWTRGRPTLAGESGQRRGQDLP